MPNNSRSKKRKLNNHHHNHAKNGELTHEEIWDDSALLRSWNDAVAEYEFYHSIHARGENLDEVLRRVEMEAEAQADAEAATAADTAVSEEIAAEDSAEEGEVDDQPESASAKVGVESEPVADQPQLPSSEGVADRNFKDKTETVRFQNQGTSVMNLNVGEVVSSAGADASGIPDDLSGQTLENVKMAYYWAGYYSGLYDGQRQRSKAGTGDQKHV